MQSVARYSPLAWMVAVAVSATAWVAHFNFPDAVFAAGFFLSAFAITAWIVARWKSRLERRAQAGETSATLQRAISYLALVAFALFAVAVHAWAVVGIYIEPARNRVYAESMGFEFGPYILLSLAASVIVGILALVAVRALRTADPARAASLWLACVLAPVAWLIIGVICNALVDGLKGQLSAFGADLPAPTLFVLGFPEYQALPVAVALGLTVVAWSWRSKTTFFRWTAAAQILVLLLSSAFFALAIAVRGLPLFSMCGQPI